MHSSALESWPRSVLHLLAVCIGASGGCARSELGWQVAPSLIRSDRSTMRAVHVPDTMTAGVADTAIIWTKSGGCTRRGPTDIVSSGPLVTIRLFDSVLVRQPDDYACPAVLRFARRVVAIRFSQPGASLVRVVGTDTTESHVLVR